MSDPLSIGIVTLTISRAGGGIFPIVLWHAKELARTGHAVTIYGLEDDPEHMDRALWGDLRLKTYASGPFGFARALLGDLAAGEHDILHQHGLWLYPSVAVSGWRRRTGRPVVISTQGMLEPWALSNAAWKKKLAGAMFERANVRGATIHCSAGEVAGVRAYAPDVPVAVIPNGADIPDLSAVPAPPTDLFPGDRRMLLFFGRLHPKKGVAELLRAWAILKSAQPDLAAQWRLVVAGWDDGGHAEGFEALARELGLSPEEICFPGPQFGEGKAALLGNAEAFILPSYSEGFPIAVLEAWAYALPVFMTRECNVTDGFAANAAIEITNRPDALSAALADSLSTADLAAIGTAGRRLVETVYGWPKIVSELASVYEWLTGRGDRPACVDAGEPQDGIRPKPQVYPKKWPSSDANRPGSNGEIRHRRQS